MKSKYIKIILSVLLDLIGMLSYLVPELGEFIDIVWAPLSSFILIKLYKNKVSKYMAVIGFVEEILPFTDLIPTFTITYVLSLFFDKKEAKI
ncbi:hypothetical protein FHR24_001815 [Wenyingzhuangia heitensis]|uniref:Uncharacterized protein n=1 Tax=Wenyingzhuangia heitensis TaxID=1487859 RepID=A0ABX0UE71_9FLAO|nr:hypothetical protein [Wenyingzhuangia heitensis]NIJ45347.1 hypothetical protein [Wenyingzhuangia heitensis]